VLDEERRRDDFSATMRDFVEFLKATGGRMSDLTQGRGSSFIERRLLDKLLFWEGKWFEEQKKAPLRHGKTNQNRKRTTGVGK
jgi:hypothetical protein